MVTDTQDITLIEERGGRMCYLGGERREGRSWRESLSRMKTCLDGDGRVMV